MNKKTKALTTEQYTEIIKTMREGTFACRPNARVATALVLEGNLGLRISDIGTVKSLAQILFWIKPPGCSRPDRSSGVKTALALALVLTPDERPGTLWPAVNP